MGVMRVGLRGSEALLSPPEAPALAKPCRQERRAEARRLEMEQRMAMRGLQDRRRSCGGDKHMYPLRHHG